jgi:salicylate hydroxylase
MRSKEIKTYLGPKHHMVAYPINEDQTSLVAAIKTDKKYKESWRVKGTLAELKKDLVMSKSDLILKLDDTTDFYKWGVYTRPSLQTLYSKNITLLGDAAHPIVPFIGQGGCLALEDAYLFGKLIISSDMEFSIAQENYQKIRMSRIKKIKTLSERQGHLNHISNKLISSIRNFIMNHMQFIAMRDIKKIWEYDIDKEILKIK